MVNANISSVLNQLLSTGPPVAENEQNEQPKSSLAAVLDLDLHMNHENFHISKIKSLLSQWYSVNYGE